MGLTLADCRRLGIPLEMHPAYSGRSEREILRERFGITEDIPPSQAVPDGMNKTERAFAEMLDSQGINYIAQTLKFRLAGRTWYRPDFVVLPGRIVGMATVIEIKGFMRDDAAVKIKVAAEMYPQFRWMLIRRDRRHGWDGRFVDYRGIGTKSILVPWIIGG